MGRQRWTARDATVYVTQVRRVICQSACVQGLFGAVDGCLAAAW